MCVLALAARHPERVQATEIVVAAAPIDEKEADQLIGLNADAHRLAQAGVGVLPESELPFATERALAAIGDQPVRLRRRSGNVPRGRRSLESALGRRG